MNWVIRAGSQKPALGWVPTKPERINKKHWMYFDKMTDRETDREVTHQQKLPQLWERALIIVQLQLHFTWIPLLPPTPLPLLLVNTSAPALQRPHATCPPRRSCTDSGQGGKVHPQDSEHQRVWEPVSVCSVTADVAPQGGPWTAQVPRSRATRNPQSENWVWFRSSKFKTDI